MNQAHCVPKESQKNLFSHISLIKFAPSGWLSKGECSPLRSHPLGWPVLPLFSPSEGRENIMSAYVYVDPQPECDRVTSSFVRSGISYYDPETDPYRRAVRERYSKAEDEDAHRSTPQVESDREWLERRMGSIMLPQHLS